MKRTAPSGAKVPRKVEELTVYSAEEDGLTFSAVLVNFAADAFERGFLRAWPEGSAAHTSYFERISNGVGYWTPERAARAGTTLS